MISIIPGYGTVSKKKIEECEAIDGWMDREDLQWLMDVGSQCDLILEVGAWKGRST